MRTCSASSPAVSGSTSFMPFTWWPPRRWGFFFSSGSSNFVPVTCVEINQWVGCFFTKSFLGDDMAALAPSSGEEPVSPRHRAGVASMAWRTTR